MTLLLLAAQAVPGGDFQRPDLPPGVWKFAALGMLFLAGRIVWQTGLLDPGQIRSPLPTARLRRTAYRVVREAFDMAPVGQAAKEAATRRAYERAHQRRTIPTLKRDGRHAVYVVVRYKQGLDLGEGSKLRGTFERRWRQAMTRPDAHGNAAHDWVFSYMTGKPTILCRWVELPTPEVVRLYQLLQPTFKWSEGTRSAEVVHAAKKADGRYDLDVPRGFRYDKAETRLGIQRQVNVTVAAPTGAWKHDWAPQEDRYTLRAVPPLPERVAWPPADLRVWGRHRSPALPVGVTHGGETIWWEYEKEGQVHAGVFGQTGAGKTGSAQSIVVAALLSGFEKVILLDPKADKDWAWLAAWPKVEFAYSLDHIAGLLADADRLREKRSKRQMDAVAANPHVDPPLAAPVLVFVDEASALFTRQRGGEATKEADFLRSLCAARTNTIAKMGRSANVHLFIGDQRPRADAIDSNTKAQLGFRIGLGDLDSIAARMIFDTSEAATDRDLGELLGAVSTAGRGFAGTVGGTLADVQLFYRPRADLIALLGPPPPPKAETAEPSEQVFGSQVAGIVVPSVKEPLSDWG